MGRKQELYEGREQLMILSMIPVLVLVEEESVVGLMEKKKENFF